MIFFQSVCVSGFRYPRLIKNGKLYKVHSSSKIVFVIFRTHNLQNFGFKNLDDFIEILTNSMRQGIEIYPPMYISILNSLNLLLGGINLRQLKSSSILAKFAENIHTAYLKSFHLFLTFEKSFFLNEIEVVISASRVTLSSCLLLVKKN